MKKIVLATALLALSGLAGAVEPTTGERTLDQTINISATIPGDVFIISPSGGWPSASVPLVYNKESDTFSAYQLNIDFSSNAELTARVLSDAVLTNDIDSNLTIATDVSIAGVLLTTSAQSIISAADFTAAGEAPVTKTLEIKAMDGMTPVAGKYNGVVSLSFFSAWTNPV